MLIFQKSSGYFSFVYFIVRNLHVELGHLKILLSNANYVAKSPYTTRAIQHGKSRKTFRIHAGTSYHKNSTTTKSTHNRC